MLCVILIPDIRFLFFFMWLQFMYVFSFLVFSKFCRSMDVKQGLNKEGKMVLYLVLWVNGDWSQEIKQNKTSSPKLSRYRLFSIEQCFSNGFIMFQNRKGVRGVSYVLFQCFHTLGLYYQDMSCWNIFTFMGCFLGPTTRVRPIAYIKLGFLRWLISKNLT